MTTHVVVLFVLTSSIVTASLAINQVYGTARRPFDIADMLLVAAGIAAVALTVRLTIFVNRTVMGTQRASRDAERLVEIASKANQRLVATAHELRAPLLALVRALEDLRRIRPNNDDELNALASILRSASEAEALATRLQGGDQDTSTRSHSS